VKNATTLQLSIHNAGAQSNDVVQCCSRQSVIAR